MRRTVRWVQLAHPWSEIAHPCFAAGSGTEAECLEAIRRHYLGGFVGQDWWPIELCEQRLESSLSLREFKPVYQADRDGYILVAMLVR